MKLAGLVGPRTMCTLLANGGDFLPCYKLSRLEDHLEGGIYGGQSCLELMCMDETGSLHAVDTFKHRHEHVGARLFR